VAREFSSAHFALLAFAAVCWHITNAPPPSHRARRKRQQTARDDRGTQGARRFRSMRRATPHVGHNIIICSVSYVPALLFTSFTQRLHVRAAAPVVNVTPSQRAGGACADTVATARKSDKRSAVAFFLRGGGGFVKPRNSPRHLSSFVFRGTTCCFACVVPTLSLLYSSQRVYGVSVSSTRRIPKLRAESQQIAAWKLLYRVQHPARYVSRLQTIPSSDIEPMVHPWSTV